MNTLWTVTGLAGVCSFLIGGIPFGLLIGRAKGIDVRQAGSGNIGAANVGRLLGRRWGVLVFLLDLLKGLVPTAVAGRVLALAGAEGACEEATIYLCWLLVGFCAVLGHNYPPFLGFRGGKGVSTSLGVALGVHPHLTIPALVAFGTWALAIRLTGMSSLGSVSGSLLFPIVYVVSMWAKGERLADTWPFLGFSLLVSVLVLVRHRRNIVRILHGTEARFSRSVSVDTDSEGASR